MDSELVCDSDVSRPEEENFEIRILGASGRWRCSESSRGVLILSGLTGGPATVNELAGPFSISQRAVSKHLAYLESARLIERQRDGRQNFCALKPDAIREVAKWAEGYRRFWEKNFQRLDGLLAEMKSQKKSSSGSAKSAVKKRNTHEKK